MATLDTLVSIALLVLGVLVLVGEFTVGFLLPFLGIALIVIAVLMLVDTLAGGTLVAVSLLVLGLLLAVGYVPVPGLVERSINLIVGVFLVVIGVARLA